MSTLTAILEPDANGFLHLQLPPELHGQRVRIDAWLQPADAPPPEPLPATKPRPQFGSMAGQFTLSPDFDDPIDHLFECLSDDAPIEHYTFPTITTDLPPAQ